MKDTQNPTWFDAHCHLADPRLETNLDEIIQRSNQAGVVGWVQGGTCPQDWDRQLNLQARYGAGIIPCFGLHPEWVDQQTQEAVEKAYQDLEGAYGRAQGMGEVGLDYRFRGVDASLIHEKKKKQRWAVEMQLKLVKKAQLPLVLHVVQAHGEMLDLLKHFGPYPRGGLVHSFSGSREIAEEYLKLGFLLSISGAVTQSGFEKLKKALKSLPPDQIVIETDAPDQLPKGSHSPESQLNEPAFLIEVAQAVANLQGIPVNTLLNQSSLRVQALFHQR